MRKAKADPHAVWMLKFIAAGKPAKALAPVLLGHGDLERRGRAITIARGIVARAPDLAEGAVTLDQLQLVSGGGKTVATWPVSPPVSIGGDRTAEWPGGMLSFREA